MEAHWARHLLNRLASVTGSSLLSPLPLPSSPLPLPSSPRPSALSSSRAANSSALSAYRRSHTPSSSTVTSSVPSRRRWAVRVSVTRRRRPPRDPRRGARCGPPCAPSLTPSHCPAHVPSGTRLVLHAAASRAGVELLRSPNYKGVPLPRTPSVRKPGMKSRIAQRSEHASVGPRGTYSHAGQSTTEPRRQYSRSVGTAQYAYTIWILRSRAVLDPARRANGISRRSNTRRVILQ